MNSGLVSAGRRLPALSGQIEELIKRDEDFRALCDDLAAAEDALAAVDHLSAELRNERRIEYESWIEGLTGEIRDALKNAKIVPFVPRPPGPTSS